MEFCGGCWADGGDAGAADVTQVLMRLEEIIEERAHAVRAGEHEPFARTEFQHRVHERLQFGRRPGLDARDLQYVRAEVGELLRKSAARAWARVTTMRWPKSGRCSNQLSFFRSFTTSPMMVTVGGGNFVFRREIADVGERAGERLLATGGAQLTIATGVVSWPCRWRRGFARSDRCVPHHHHDFRAGFLASAAQFTGQSFSAGIFVAGEDGELRAMIAVRERNAGVVGHGGKRGHAGHDLKGDFASCKRSSFLAAATEHVGIAAFEAHDGFAFARFGDELFDDVGAIVLGVLERDDRRRRSRRWRARV